MDWRDRIITFYINLERRTDRCKEMEEELTLFAFRQWTRFKAVDRPGRGDVGCTMSHAMALQMAREELSLDPCSPVNYVLMLEDDFEFVVTQAEFDEEMRKFFDFPHRVDVCMLSFSTPIDHNDPKSKDVDTLRRIRKAHTSSGYLIHKDYLLTLADCLWTAVPLLESTGQHWLYTIDQVWVSLMEKDEWYRFTTRVGKQRKSFSDLGGCVVDRGF